MMKRIIIFLLAVAVVEVSLYSMLTSFKERRLDAYYEQRILLAQNNFESAVSSFEQVFKNIVKDKLDVDEAKALIHSAASDPVHRDRYRNWLRIYTNPIYESLRSMGLTHMHFHFKDGTSFLRMHRTGYHGDDLSFRTGVMLINEKKEYIKGFENGRHLLAYRFFFPLSYQGEHIGSLELSVGLKEFTEIMNRLYGIGYAYLLEKDKVFRNYTATATAVDDYLKNSVTDEYVMGMCDACVMRTDPACTQEDIREDLVASIVQRNMSNIKNYKTFAEISPLHNKILFTYTPIFDMNGTGMGYLVSHSIVGGYAYIQKTYKALFIFISIGAVSIISIFFALEYSRRKTAQLNSVLEKRVAEKIQELQDKEQFFSQQSKMATMGEMLASILHQWKQPINSISLIADLLLFECDHKGCDKETHSSLENIKQQAHFMSQTGNDFRNFMKPSKDKVVFCVAEAVNEVLKLFEFSFTRYGIGFEKEWDSDTAEQACVFGYPNEFKHVLLNIFNNSRDAIVQLREKIVERGEDVSDYEGVITISISVTASEAYVRISDTGGGIPEDIIDKVFEKYFSTKDEEGSGIGLYMSKEMVEKSMNGTMSVRNIIGGAEFTLIFPKAEKNEE